MPVRARPIPRHLLIHSATHYYGTPTKDTWGNVTYPSNQALTHVRFEPSGKLVKTKDNTELRLSMLMIYDEVNSAPQGAIFDHGDKITFGGRSYRVEVIDLLYDGERLHHKEIGLV